MSGSVSNETKAEPNLTPILDMVFQLITFFMLVMNFKAAEIDKKLQLPSVGSGQPVPVDENMKLMVLNLRSTKKHPEGLLTHYGNIIPADKIDAFIEKESNTTLREIGKTVEDIHEKGEELPTTVVLRADAKVQFHTLNRVITCCQEHGFRKFALKVQGQGEKGNFEDSGGGEEDE